MQIQIRSVIDILSIDEAIAHAREVAEKQRKDNDNCEYKAEYGCKGCADYYSNYSGTITGSFAVSELGKTVFLTKAEAEQKLKEMEV